MTGQDAHDYLCFKGYEISPSYAEGIKEYHISLNGVEEIISKRNMIALASRYETINLAISLGYNEESNQER